MKYKLIVLAVVAAFIALAMGMSQANSFNPGEYPYIYHSAASPGATPTSGSGIIYTPTTSNYSNGAISGGVACEFYNSGTNTQYYTIYDSNSIATQNPSNALCSVAIPGPGFGGCTGPAASGGGGGGNGALLAKNGLTWGESAAYPGPTGSPDVNSLAICTYIVR